MYILCTSNKMCVLPVIVASILARTRIRKFVYCCWDYSPSWEEGGAGRGAGGAGAHPPISWVPAALCTRGTLVSGTVPPVWAGRLPGCFGGFWCEPPGFRRGTKSPRKSIFLGDFPVGCEVVQDAGNLKQKKTNVDQWVYSKVLWKALYMYTIYIYLCTYIIYV